jgi:hypothetical protein
MKMVKHHNIVKLYEVLASRTKVRAGWHAAQGVLVCASPCRPPAR